MRLDEYALSTKRCMMGNQDPNLALVVWFALCSRFSPLFEVVSRTFVDDIAEVNEVRNFSMFSAILNTFLVIFSDIS